MMGKRLKEIFGLILINITLVVNGRIRVPFYSLQVMP